MPDTTLPPPLTAKDVAPAPAPDTAKAAVATPPAVVADSAVSDKLRDILGGNAERIASRKADREGMESFYKAHNYAPLWLSAGAANERAKSAIATLAQADTVGLDPSDYPVPDFKAAVTADAQAEAELKLTAAVLTFARHAQAGRISYTRVSPDLSFDPVAPEPAAVLAKLADGSDAGKVLDAYNPPQAEFAALKAKLVEVRKNGGIAAPKVEEDKPITVKVGEGKILRPGMKDARVIALRKRLDVKGDKDSPLYDDAVRDAVKVFQTEADLDADGNLGANTVKALNGEKKVAHGPTADPIDTIVVNMERWRWYPRDLGNPHVIVNIPNYQLTLWNDDKVYWQTKIVVGKPGKNTPLISAEMKFITVNPTWNVPPSIIEKEYLPALQQDPQALDRIGLKLTQDADGTVHIAQPPGAGNALGRIRFNFPNKYLVYQHDTPDKYLFAKEERAFSHGCMRVQNPLTYGEKLLSLVLPQDHYTEAKLEKMFGGSEININFPKNIWVHLTYQTAFVDEDGKLQLRKDVYGWDQRMLSIFKGSERKVADIAVEQKMNSSSKPVKMTPGMYGGSGGGFSGFSGGGFFDALFGGSARAQQPVYRPQAPVNAPRGRVSQR
jgi:murein L,D-transpeptidase YcbB/YkuD